MCICFGSRPYLNYCFKAPSCQINYQVIPQLKSGGFMSLYLYLPRFYYMRKSRSMREAGEEIGQKQKQKQEKK